MVQQRPLVYHHICYLNDGTTQEQYSRERNYKGLPFTDIKQDKLIKFGLYPFTQDLAIKVTKAGSEARSLPFLPEYEIEFNKNKRLIYYRQCFISQQEYHICNSCREEFTYDGTIETLSSKYSSPICPNCGAYDDFLCERCNKTYIFEESAHGLCPSCKGHMQRRKTTSTQYSREKRWNQYIIGSQQLVNGQNVKHLLTIDETGNCLVT